MGNMPVVDLSHARKAFGENEVLKDISLTVNKGDVLSIIGPSGGGKSTLLRCMTLLETLDAGSLSFGDLKVAESDSAGKAVYGGKEVLAQAKKRYGLVFQNFNLFPHFTVLQNVTDALISVQKRPKEEALARGRELLAKMGLADKESMVPCELSGGQQQRVAIARALVKMPRVLLLDEPLSNLDARLRLQTREEIRRIQRETKITTVFVTHDQDEAMSISDFIVVMKAGVVQQIGKPQAVYDDPDNLFVAKFLGTPPINVFNGAVKGGKLYIGEEAVLSVNGVNDGEVYVGIRPEGFILDENGPLGCKLINVEVMGRDVSVVSSNPASLNPTIRSIINADAGVDHDAETVRFSVKPHKLFLFDKESEKRIRFEVK